MPYLTLLEKGWTGRDYHYEGIGGMLVDEVLPCHLETALDAVLARAQRRWEDRNEVRSGIGRVEFRVSRRNGRSQAAMRKLGAVREGLIRADRITWTGHVRDTVLFAILKDEWPV